MSASARKRRFVERLWGVAGLLFMMSVLQARDAPALQYRREPASGCQQELIDSHVREQLAIYGPLSGNREYFGFIFLHHGKLRSAVIRGPSCGKSCGVHTAAAAALIPPGATVLGEWHSHPHASNAGTLSAEDARGAYDNRHIRCYAAYYSQPDGDIYAWDPQQVAVPSAMASRVLIGRYGRESPAGPRFAGSVDADSAAIIAAQENPGTQCLSTNTNVHTAATTKKSCRRSTTSR